MVVPKSFDPSVSSHCLAAQQVTRLPPSTQLLPPLSRRLPLVVRELFPWHAIHAMDFGLLVVRVLGLKVLAPMSLIFSRRDYTLT
jgi:hypothetical protein